MDLPTEESEIEDTSILKSLKYYWGIADGNEKDTFKDWLEEKGEI